MSRRPQYECESVQVGETFALESPKDEPLPEPNVSPYAYFVCGVGWSHFIVLEVVDVV